MSDVITSFLLVSGSLFSLVAALGMLRLPDTIMRMHAATKAGTLGAGLILIAEATFYQEIGITLRALAAITFLLLTAPVAAHSHRSGRVLFRNQAVEENLDRPT